MAKTNSLFVKSCLFEIVSGLGMWNISALPIMAEAGTHVVLIPLDLVCAVSLVRLWSRGSTEVLMLLQSRKSFHSCFYFIYVCVTNFL